MSKCCMFQNLNSPLVHARRRHHHHHLRPRKGAFNLAYTKVDEPKKGQDDPVTLPTPKTRSPHRLHDDSHKIEPDPQLVRPRANLTT